MSIYVSIPKEIKDYEPKIMIGLSYRNLIYGTPALVIGLGGFTLASFCMDSQIASTNSFSSAIFCVRFFR